MSDEVSLPPAPGADADLEELRSWIQRAHQWLQTREPLADGGVLDKFLTGRSALALGIGTLIVGGGGTGTSGDVLQPGPGTYSPADKSQPDDIAGLVVTPGISFFFVEVEAPTYGQGGGNGRTVIYAATYSGAGPLPTFANAVEVYQIFGRATIAVIDAEPGVQMHFWAKAETRAGTLQADPTGGTNGVSAVCGKIDGAEHIKALSIGTAQIDDLAVTDAKIVTLSVAKLTAGSLAVGEYAQSTGFVSSSSGWQIKGDGTAEFSGVIVRGTVYASAGLIGGITIDANGIYSNNFDGTVDGSGNITDTGTEGFALTKAGQIALDVTLTRDSKSMAAQDTVSVYDGAAVSSVSFEQPFAEHQGNGFAVLAGCNGYLNLYLNTSGARVLEIGYYLLARETTTLDECYGPGVTQTVDCGGGVAWSASSSYRYALPINTHWLFGGSYWTETGAMRPGTAGTPASPVQIDNFLSGSGTWEIILVLNVTCYSPGTATASAVIEDARLYLGGWKMDLPGSVAFDEPSAPSWV